MGLSVKGKQKGPPLAGRPFLSFGLKSAMRSNLESAPGEPDASALEELLAERLPYQHHKSKTLFERRNLISHWITSFTLVEHPKMLRRISVVVKSQIATSVAS